MKEGKSDPNLIESIQRGGTELDHAIKALYIDSEPKSTIFRKIIFRGGNREDAEDIFHEGIRQLIINVRSGKYKHTGSLSSYLTAICYNLWHTQFSRLVKLNRIKQKLQPSESPTSSSPENIYLWKEQTQSIEEILDHLSEDCKNILGYWSLEYSFNEIGKIIGKSEGATRKQKYICFKKLMALLKKRPDLLKKISQLEKNKSDG
ncbi:MAG: sigma-70 family RNA polymerase sigma factor [Bacteroidetes bacterium]|nr:sigma-70 family RNA polymerase sigma factor [Bacteroidota bacterium]